MNRERHENRKNLLYRAESYNIQGAIFDVYKEMGCGFLEAVYHRMFRSRISLFIEQNIPPTNNLGEQTIRKVVIDRKVTQGTRSDLGNRWQERFWSILTTCEQQGKNVMAFLNACVKSFLHGLAPPSLING